MLIVPMTVIMMRQGYDFWQNKVLLAIIDKLQSHIRESQQLDLFGIQEDIILSIKFKDMGIRRADYDKFRSRLSSLSLIPVTIPSKLNNESYQRYHRLGTVFFEEHDSKEFMIELDKDVVHHIISKEFGFCTLNKETFLACKTRYSQQIYLMLAGLREEGKHSFSLTDLQKQLSLAQSQRQLCFTQKEKVLELKDIPSILSDTKKELDELLASGSGDLSFNYTIDENGVGERFLNIEILTSVSS